MLLIDWTGGVGKVSFWKVDTIYVSEKTMKGQRVSKISEPVDVNHLGDVEYLQPVSTTKWTLLIFILSWSGRQLPICKNLTQAVSGQDLILERDVHCSVKYVTRPKRKSRPQFKEIQFMLPANMFWLNKEIIHSEAVEGATSRGFSKWNAQNSW